ncbi:hypothetical protein TPL01_15500 [Sulfuriferula plumbiphila]|uniref:Uncharacterized protein n=1 Tax=Sulfuriferula plumbiphila TaxID=171865 RepID=A0A512L7I1_9PROT|nr:hypothetical protein [Sulfuriferula plumbiphila]BBP05375.1 hypothetical protein SFPGR_27970 [Sulfuriferula plumbiphila]GEP30412.1 hypothetical protein TPL01_15500 [Sulfuriferula plumbiphila]
METLPISLAQLQGMIGMCLRWRGVDYAVVEVLEDGPALVAQSLVPNTAIQGDVHGRARREVQQVVVIPVLNLDKTLLHPEFLEIELL